jgi:PHD/YefM family antitoxin component YafN of YafNO toxin-antitoxin module
MTGSLSVAAFRADLPAVLARFRAGQTRAFSFGDGVPEAVVLTYDEFEDLGGEAKFAVADEVLEPEVLAGRLAELMRAIRTGQGVPIVWGVEGEPEAVVLSTADYRTLRGDDEPPPGVVDDPTQRTYVTEPLPDSRAMTMDEIAELMGPEAVEDLAQIRRERRDREQP